MLDNGAFTAWKGGRIPDWKAWSEWVEPWLAYQTTWCVLPDSVDGGVAENDRLLREFTGFGDQGAAVWHLHEPIGRLVDLCGSFKMVCFGSSGQFKTVGDTHWHYRASEAFDAITDTDGRCRVWIHMLRGMSLSGSHYPFASVDSTDIARNHHLVWNDSVRMANRWDALQCPGVWVNQGNQLEMEGM